MDKSLLDSAVKFGIELMASENDLPKESVESVLSKFLSKFTVSEICDSFNYSIIQVLKEKRCEFDLRRYLKLVMNIVGQIILREFILMRVNF